ncbi:MAG: PIN domain-containing protein [Chloroflexota bacterium]|nr:PIN domain-containing protein [Chloroflexota bacterium]
MATEIFIGTGAWIALADRKDPFHATATEFYPNLLKQWPNWITTNLVIAEAYSLIRRRIGHLMAITFLDNIQNIVQLHLIYSDPTIEAQAEAILCQYADQDFSYVDAVRFAVMRQRGISEAVAFDHHFTTAGFTRVV